VLLKVHLLTHGITLPRSGTKGLSHDSTRYEVPELLRYAKASKKERTKMLDEYVATTGCHRKHTTAVLSGKRQRVTHPIRRPRRRRYTDEDARAVQVLAELSSLVGLKCTRSDDSA